MWIILCMCQQHVKLVMSFWERNHCGLILNCVATIATIWYLREYLDVQGLARKNLAYSRKMLESNCFAQRHMIARFVALPGFDSWTVMTFPGRLVLVYCVCHFKTSYWEF